MYLTRKKLVGNKEIYDELTQQSGDLWNNIVNRFWRTVRNKDQWLSKSSIQRWLCKDVDGLHSQSAQAVADQFFSALNSWRQQRKNNSDMKPPHKQKDHNKVIWKSSAIRCRNDKLYLSRGRSHEPLIFEWGHGEPKMVELGWNNQANEYELRVQYKINPTDKTTGNKTASVDLGEIHLACVYDGNETLLFNGKELRSKRQYQNKLKATLNSKIDQKQKGSNRYNKLIQSKNDQLADIHNQIRDICHKMSKKLVSMCLERNVDTLVIGDVRNIRQNIDYGSKANQKLHQWIHGTFRRMIEYKAKLVGMGVKLQNEANTSKRCPSCGTHNNPDGRDYSCSSCGFEYHRDGVGAINIRSKYLGNDSQVVGDMASPTGVRFKPNMSCSSSSVCKTQDYLEPTR